MARRRLGRLPVEAKEQNDGGLEHRFVEEVPEKFICSICTRVQREPHLTSCCGQHFCESCLENWFEKQLTKSCPHCREKRIVHIVNKERKREINELKIYCTHHEEGCQWIGELGDLQTHLNSESGCGYVEVECTNSWYCSKMKRKDLQEHLSSECPKRTYNCEHCEFEDTYEEITTYHYDECPEYPLECPNECGVEAIKRKDMSAHRAECPEERVECPNGCDGELDGDRVEVAPLSGNAAIVGEVVFADEGKESEEELELPRAIEDIPPVEGSDDEEEVSGEEESDGELELPRAIEDEEKLPVEYEEESDDDSVILQDCLKKVKCRTLKRKDLPHHLSDECYLRKYKCEHCGHEDTYENITGIKDGERQEGTSHYDTCPEYPLDCPNECGAETMKRKDMSTHRAECLEEPMKCPFKEAGCETKLVRRDFDDHMSTQTQQHLLLTFQKMTVLSTNYDALSESHDTLSESHDTLKENYDTLSESHDTLKENYDTLSESHDALKESHDTLSVEHDALKESHDTLSEEHHALKRRYLKRCNEPKQTGRPHKGLY